MVNGRCLTIWIELKRPLGNRPFGHSHSKAPVTHCGGGLYFSLHYANHGILRYLTGDFSPDFKCRLSCGETVPRSDKMQIWQMFISAIIKHAQIAGEWRESASAALDAGIYAPLTLERPSAPYASRNLPVRGPDNQCCRKYLFNIRGLSILPTWSNLTLRINKVKIIIRILVF